MSSRVSGVVAVVTLAFTASACVSDGAPDRPAQPGVSSGAISSCGDRGESNFYFANGGVVLDQAARDEIANVQSRLHGCRIQRVVITGSASDRDLAARRADVVAAALAEGGWDRAVFEISAHTTASAGGVVQPLSERVNVLIVTAAAD